MNTPTMANCKMQALSRELGKDGPRLTILYHFYYTNIIDVNNLESIDD